MLSDEANEAIEIDYVFEGLEEKLIAEKYGLSIQAIYKKKDKLHWDAKRKSWLETCKNYITPQQKIQSYELTESLIIKEQLEEKRKLSDSEIKTLLNISKLKEANHGEGFYLSSLGRFSIEIMEYIRDKEQNLDLLKDLKPVLQHFIKWRLKVKK